MSTIKISGEIWDLPSIRRGQIVRRVCESLESKYGKPRLGNPLDPLDDLIYIILSTRTSQSVAKRTFHKIKDKYSSWERVLLSPRSKLESIIEPAGLSLKRSLQIVSTLEKIKGDFGSCDLSPLKAMSISEAEAYLLSLAGVSQKVAKCVMLYTLNAEVLPVDGHVFRVSKRLGWTNRNRADQCHDELELLVPPHRRFSFHVDCIQHGRSTCKAHNPSCQVCSIQTHCRYYELRYG